MKNQYLDMLALIGEGSAHPGGFSATVDLLSSLNLDERMDFLDVGCGTGRTACYVSTTYPCHVSGIDSHPLMISKAKRRAHDQQVQCQFVCGNATQMPFEDQQFDVVMAESVTVFTTIEDMLSECYRVLKFGGKVANIELCKYRFVPESRMMDLFGIKRIPSVEEWKEVYECAGFKE